MIEQTILDHLAARLGVPAYMEIPPAPPPAFVVLEKTGSGRTNHISRATLAIQSYAPTLLEAARLNEAVKAAMDDAADLDEIARSALNSDYNFTDTASRRCRYQAVYDVVHY